MNIWAFHDDKMKELRTLYNKTSKQTQNRLQEIFNSINYDYTDLYNIANNKSKNMINNYIEEWKDKGLLIGYFGYMANNIYKRTRVKNNEILELLIYEAYIEEQSKLDSKEQDLMKQDTNYYYQQGQQEVKPLLNKKALDEITDDLFIILLAMQNSKGYVYKDYQQAIIQNNANQIYRQATIDLQQGKIPDIDNYSNIIQKQLNQKICINGDKISGDLDNQLIGMNNLAKVEGIKHIVNDDNAKIRFIAVTDEHSTDMCQSMNNMEFYINKENKFERYWGDNAKDTTMMPVSVKGLVPGINLPPIIHYWHWCRSTITYIPIVENKEKMEYNKINYIRNNKYTNSKNLDGNIKKALNKLPIKIQTLIKDTKYIISNSNSCYDRKNDIIYLLDDSNKYEVLHEIGHAIETKLNILHDKKYIEIQKQGIDVTQYDINNINGYDKNNEFWISGNKFISNYQRRVYEEDIDGNSKLNYLNYTFNTKTLGEYFSEGFRSYFEENALLKRKDIDLYNYIKEVLK